MKTVQTLICCVGIVAVLAITRHACGVVVISHSGATDMTTEGWTYYADTSSTPPASASPVINDLGLGIDAWLLDDPDGNGRVNHRGNNAFTAAHYTQIDSSGYSVRFNIRVDDMSANGYDQFLGTALNINVDESHFTTGVGHRTSIFLGQDGNGDTIVQLKNDAAQTVDHTISGGGYHFYELRGDPTTALADLYVDGTLEIDDFPISTPSSKGDQLQLGWDKYGKLAVYYNSFVFETAPGAPIIPEPTTLVLLTFGLAGLLAYPWRKRK